MLIEPDGAEEPWAVSQQCCTFFDFTLHLAGGALHLEVRAPAEAAPLIRDVFGATR